MTIINDQMWSAFQIASCRKRSRGLLARLGKLFEEGGELAEASLFAAGHNQHKTFKELPEGEVADVILCAIDVLGALYPNEEAYEIERRLTTALEQKITKWQDTLAATRNGEVIAAA